MFRSFFPVALVFSMFLLGAATSDIEPSKPIVAWLTPKEHDFGEIKRERPVHHSFKFKNISDAPVQLETVRTSCGCTAADWSEAAVAPGDTGEINIEYDAYLSGDFSKKIRVFFRQQRKSEILKIQGSVH